MPVADELRSILLENGASLVGFADLSGFRADMRHNMPGGLVYLLLLFDITKMLASVVSPCWLLRRVLVTLTYHLDLCPG